MTRAASRMVTTPRPIDPRRYHEAADPNRSPVAPEPPVWLYLEVVVAVK